MADLVWSDPDPEKEDFAISPRYTHLEHLHFSYSLITSVVLGIPLDLALFTNFSIKTGCLISFVHTNCAWKDTLPYLISTFPQFGRLLIIVIDVEIWQVFWKLVLARRCFSMYSRPHQKMTETVRISRALKTQPGRWELLSLSLPICLIFYNQLPEYFLWCPLGESAIFRLQIPTTAIWYMYAIY